MKDRVSQHPGRFRMTDVGGGLVDLELADQPLEAGTPLNKTNLLKDETAELFGLESSAVPDDVLAWLGRFNEYAWEKKEVTKTNISTLVNVVNSASNPRTIYYSSQIGYENGDFVLVNPQTASIDDSAVGASTLASLAPCYISNAVTNPNTKIYYLPSGITSGTDASAGVFYYASNATVRFSETATVRAKTITIVDSTDYVFSTNRSAYPDIGIVGDYFYKYAGIPFNNAASVHTKIETGSYRATGTYGTTHPTVIHIPDWTKIVFIASARNDGGHSSALIRGNTVGCSLVGSAEWERFPTLTWTDTTLSIVDPNYANGQFNVSGGNYYYIAIG